MAAGRPDKTSGSAGRLLGREGAAQGKSRDFKHQGKDKQGQRDHEDGNLGIWLGGQSGGVGWRDTSHYRHDCTKSGQAR